MTKIYRLKREKMYSQSKGKLYSEFPMIYLINTKLYTLK